MLAAFSNILLMKHYEITEIESDDSALFGSGASKLFTIAFCE